MFNAANKNYHSRLFVAFLLAPLIPGLVFLILAQTWNFNVYLVAALVSYFFAIAIGYPSYLYLKKKNKLHFAWITACSFLVGYIPLLLLLLGGQSKVDIASVDGMVTVLNGTITFKGLLYFFYTAGIGGLLSLVSGIVWYFIARPFPTNELEKHK